MEKKIAVIGLGYVGLPLAVEFAKQYPTVGFDINGPRVDELMNGRDCTREVEDEDLKEVIASDLTSIVRKVSGIDTLVERVTANLPSLEQVWICGDLAKGLPSEYIEAILVGAGLDRSYIKRLIDKAQSLTGKTVTVKVEEEIVPNGLKDGLLVWQKEDEQ